MRFVLMAHDKYYWLLRGFQHQWRKHGEYLPVTIAGFSEPDIDLLPGFDFISLGKAKDYPAERWSDACLKMLDMIGDNQIIIVLEDYWLTRPINLDALNVGKYFMQDHPEALRFDLTTDRLYSQSFQDIGSIGPVDIIKANDPNYCLSLQASLWNVNVLRKILIPGETPWEVELQGSGRAADLEVYGTRQWPIRYQIMVRSGHFSKSGAWQMPARQLSEADYLELERLGYTERT